MKETLKMMKSILTGKEEQKNELELINEYKENLSPNILAYFYKINFGLLINISNKYPKLTNEDKASFCLQELDNCLQRFDENQGISFRNYFIQFYKYRLNNEQKRLQFNSRDIMHNYKQLDEIIDIGKDDNIEDYNLILNEYKLNLEEKKQCKLMLAGYTIKEIHKLFNISTNHLYYNNSKIKQKILNLI